MTRSDFARMLQTMLYESFAIVQGDQRIHVHVLQTYARLMHERHIDVDYAAKDILLDRVRRRHVPSGHLPIPPDHQAAVFHFWYLLAWDILECVYRGDPAFLPIRSELDERVIRVGGTTSMSSFTVAELNRIEAGLAGYRRAQAAELTACDIVAHYVVPGLLEVEAGFQGDGATYPTRPRTDGGDPHESRLWTLSQTASRKHRLGKPSLTDMVMRLICQRLEHLSTDAGAADTASLTYRSLVQAYNDNHPSGRLSTLHAAPGSFIAGRPVTSHRRRRAATLRVLVKRHNNQVIQMSGALLLLTSFFLMQQGIWVATSGIYLAANATGAAILAVVALVQRQWGFLILEGAWSVLSLVDIARGGFV